MNPYKVLEVSNSSSQEEIKKSYRILVKKFHPDLNPGDKKREEKFKEITHAYDLIGTDKARKQFDIDESTKNNFQENQYRPNKRRTPDRDSRPFSTQFGNSNFFDEIFKKHEETIEKKEKNKVHYQLTISFKESIIGTEKVITLPNNKKIKLKIPSGVVTGSKLRLANLNVEESSRFKYDNSYLELVVLPLEGWKRTGLDVENEVAISFIEGILGADISVDTMYGPIMLKIPPGVNTGSKLRIKNKGVKSTNQIGHQIITLKVVLPNINPELSKVIVSWEGVFDYNPREKINY